MGDILAKRHRATLADFACSSVLLGFDYDGTLAPIASRPASARMRRATRHLLGRVARRYPSVVISGRTRDDLARRLGRLPLWHMIGNHGLEPWAENATSAAQVRQWVTKLRARLAGHRGVVVEDKTFSVTVHYRHARHKARVRRLIAGAIRALNNVRALQGEQAISLILRDGPNKGVALQRVRRVLSCETAIYVGDDGTDEDAFASAPPDQLLAIRVGPVNGTRAPYHIRSQASIDRLLESLLQLRTPIRSVHGSTLKQP
jgi:trehalose 6-phosphate phosphatase